MMDPTLLDSARLNFDAGGLLALNVVLALIMFGVALDLRTADFSRVIEKPKSPLVGLFAQFFVLPALTWVLTLILRPPPSVALGMILVAACPGGSVSNFISSLAQGNLALSVSLTAVSTAGAALLTPLNIELWGSLNPETAALLTDLHLPYGKMLMTVSLILLLPLALGMTLRAQRPLQADRLSRPLKIFSLLALFGFIIGALLKNWSTFSDHLGTIAVIVALHNTLALGTGWSIARLAKLPAADRRTLTIEVGIQNSGLGLVLIFNFFDGLGGMAVIAGWWGLWHIVAGLTVAGFWHRRRPVESV